MAHAARFSTILSLCAAVLVSGCGVIRGYGNLQPVQVVTVPEGATLVVDGVPWDTPTPCQVMLHPKSNHHIIAKTADGKSGATTINKKIRTDVVILDGVLTLGIGLLVDYLSGSLYELQPAVAINLGAAPPRVDPPKTGGTTSTTTTTTVGPAPDAAPCSICGEPRGDVATCPHCGMQ